MIAYFFFFVDMIAHSPRDRSRSPLASNGTVAAVPMNHSSVKQLPAAIHSLNHDDPSSQVEQAGSNNTVKSKKESEFQQHMKNLKVG